MTSILKVYTVGFRPSPMLVTIEVLNRTDKSGLNVIPVNLHCPFYLSGLINCGRILRITDLSEKKEYGWAILDTVIGKKKVKVDQYFDIPNYDYAANCGLKVYMYKIAAVEGCDHVSEGYCGAAYKHYPGGNIRTKLNYYKGDIAGEYLYRNDVYNTMEINRTYKKGVIDTEFFYDKRERYIGKRAYKSNGDVFTETGENLPVLEPNPKVNELLSSESESESDITDLSDSDIDL